MYAHIETSRRVPAMRERIVRQRMSCPWNGTRARGDFPALVLGQAPRVQQGESGFAHVALQWVQTMSTAAPAAAISGSRRRSTLVIRDEHDARR